MLLDESLGDLLGSSLDNCLQLAFQVGTLLIHLLDDIKSFNNDVKMILLLESLFGHLENKTDLLLVKGDVFHAEEFGL